MLFKALVLLNLHILVHAYFLFNIHHVFNLNAEMGMGFLTIVYILVFLCNDQYLKQASIVLIVLQVNEAVNWPFKAGIDPLDSP